MFYVLKATGQKFVKINDLSISSLSSPELELGGLFQCVETGGLVCRIAAHDSIPVDANIQDGIDVIVQSNNNPYGCDREAIAAAILDNIDKQTHR